MDEEDDGPEILEIKEERSLALQQAFAKFLIENGIFQNPIGVGEGALLFAWFAKNVEHLYDDCPICAITACAHELAPQMNLDERGHIFDKEKMN